MVNDEGVGRLSLGQRLIASALKYHSASASEIKQLPTWRHNAHLVDHVASQLRKLSDGFERDTGVTYAIQSMSDNGCDVLVRYNTTEGVTYIGIQIKSHVELAEKEIVNKLLLQYSRACDHYDPLLRYYILLAADNTGEKSKEKEVVWSINQAFSKKPKVTVVQPGYAYSFLRLTPEAMDGLLTSTFRSGDPVTEESISDLRRPPLDCAVLLTLLVNALGSGSALGFQDLSSNAWLSAVAHFTPLDPLAGHGEYPWDLDYLNATLLHELYVSKTIDLADSQPESDHWEDFDEYDFDEVDLGALPRDLLCAFLSPPMGEVTNSARIERELNSALDRLEDELTVTERDTGPTYDVPLRDHPALVCLLTEGTVRHDYAGQELIDYLIELLLRGNAENPS